uniref:UPF0606 protein KIAA1549-like n=1 Tax=Paramormyrops kingsleyae TaxID=1676925 RepID=A0A3B3SIR4_9TELE|nr:UPF0606 protein KIAA1549-like [Paramormyrops kingsleyae]
MLMGMQNGPSRRKEFHPAFPSSSSSSLSSSSSEASGPTGLPLGKAMALLIGPQPQASDLGLLPSQNSGPQDTSLSTPAPLDPHSAPFPSGHLFPLRLVTPSVHSGASIGEQVSTFIKHRGSRAGETSSMPIKWFSGPPTVKGLVPHGLPHNNVAQGIPLFLTPPVIVTPSFIPFNILHVSSAPGERTLVSPEHFYPSKTVEADWGSGDYLETLTLMGSEDEFRLATSLPFGTHDIDAPSAEVYDTLFPSRVVLPLSSLRISSSHTATVAYGANLHSADQLSVQLSHSHPTHKLPNTSLNNEVKLSHDLDWTDTYSIEPTEILLPDMNSLEYYTNLLTRGNGSLAEQRRNLTFSVHYVSIEASHIAPTSSVAMDMDYKSSSPDKSSFTEGSSTDVLGAEMLSSTDRSKNGAVNGPEHLLEPSAVPAPYLSLSTLLRNGLESNAVQMNSNLPSLDTATVSSHISTVQLTVKMKQNDSPIFPSSAAVFTPTAGIAPTPMLTDLPKVTASATGQTPNTRSNPTAMAEQTLVLAGIASEFPAVTADEWLPTASTAMASTMSMKTTPNKPYTPTTSLTTTTSPLVTTTRAVISTTPRQYLCNISKADSYLIRVGFPVESTTGYAKSHLREILKREFNRSVELHVLKAPPNFVFRVVSGSVLYTAAAVINALRQSQHDSPVALTASTVYPMPSNQYQVHSVLQFVPPHVDVRVCSFTEHVEKGLTMAYSEVRRRMHNPANFIIQIINITMGATKTLRQQRAPVDITFAVRDFSGYLEGSLVSSHLRLLTMVEFSFYVGFPVLQIAEPFHYPELNVSQVLRSSWVKTVLLGVLDQRVGERTFQARMERRLALLLGEVLGASRRWKRATSVGNNSVQIVKTSRLEGSDYPLEMVYFVEGPTGERLPAVATSSLLNRVDVQRAAIVLGYRVQGTLAQPVEKLTVPPSETHTNNTWIIVGVVAPVVLAVGIVAILYWKLCRSDKLEFQPDAMSTIQQRQKMKELQPPTVKGFDFAKLHLGQHNKDDITVIQEPPPPPLPVKEMTPSENADVLTPKSKASSTKQTGATRHKGRISPSDADSMGSNPSSGRESAEENARIHETPSEGKQLRKPPKNGPSAGNGANDQQSSASIFEHVDRASRPSECTRRVANKIQLIAMQPMPAPAPNSPPVIERVLESTSINREIRVALRQKSEIEQYRNKIRLRAKRKGHYDFPTMDDLMDGFEPKDVYQKAQLQFDRILDPDVHVPSVYMEPRKSKGRRSPKERKRSPMNGSLVDTDSDRLIPMDNDTMYRKFPGVNNIAYVSDPDQALEPRSPSPSDDVFATAPPPYVPPQPSIEEARQQMHSLLDDAFALVSPSSEASVANASPPPRTPHGQWAPPHPTALPLSPVSARYAESGMSPPTVQGVLQRQDLGSSYLPPSDTVHDDPLPPLALYSGRGLYAEELPSSARPRPVGGTTGTQLHHLTQVGLSSQISAYPGTDQTSSSQTGVSSWGHYHPEDDYLRPDFSQNQVPVFPEYTSSWVLQMPRTSLREPSAPPAPLDPTRPGYPAVPPEETSPSSHSSASLIKAIREELVRLSQKQSAVPSYHK